MCFPPKAPYIPPQPPLPLPFQPPLALLSKYPLELSLKLPLPPFLSSSPSSSSFPLSSLFLLFPTIPQPFFSIHLFFFFPFSFLGSSLKFCHCITMLLLRARKPICHFICGWFWNPSVVLAHCLSFFVHWKRY